MANYPDHERYDNDDILEMKQMRAKEERLAPSSVYYSRNGVAREAGTGRPLEDQGWGESLGARHYIDHGLPGAQETYQAKTHHGRLLPPATPRPEENPYANREKIGPIDDEVTIIKEQYKPRRID